MEVVSGGDLSQHLEALLSLSCHPYLSSCTYYGGHVRGRLEPAALDYFFAVHDTIATAVADPGAAEVAALPAREHRGAASAEVAAFYPAARSHLLLFVNLLKCKELSLKQWENTNKMGQLVFKKRQNNVENIATSRAAAGFKPEMLPANAYTWRVVFGGQYSVQLCLLHHFSHCRAGPGHRGLHEKQGAVHEF